MSSYSKRTFNWSEKEFSLKELAASYGRWLPFPVLVTCGCPQRKKPKASPSSDQVSPRWFRSKSKGRPRANTQTDTEARAHTHTQREIERDRERERERERERRQKDFHTKSSTKQSFEIINHTLHFLFLRLIPGLLAAQSSDPQVCDSEKFSRQSFENTRKLRSDGCASNVKRNW